jgi:hypothetical protein
MPGSAAKLPWKPLKESSMITATVPATVPARADRSIPLWTLRREATLNWLALGLLLAAWNASYNDVPQRPPSARPDALRGYPSVSVRALQRFRDNSIAR